jgi:hypothetical protein
VVLAPRGLREEEDGTRVRMAEEWLVAVQAQALKVWIEALATTALVTGVAVLLAWLRR